ncbi:MAG TPA: TadE/TadG family type IV pilus assembly protein [Bryobacteraceae bacterium]
MRRKAASRRGNAAIEFALSFMLLWGTATGAFRYGYPIYVYQSLLSAVSAAARFSSRADFDTGQTFVAGVKNMAVYGSPAGGTAALVPGLTTGSIGVTWTTDSKGAPQAITVAVSSYSVNTMFQTFTFSGKPSVTVRYAGVYKP